MSEEDQDYLYDSVFAQASFQFCGHIDAYLIAHTRHLCLFYAQTRFGKGGHLVRRFENGKLSDEHRITSSRNILLYYLLGWWHWFGEVRQFAKHRKAVCVLFTHPLNAFGLKALGNVRSVFWQWDYFPDKSIASRLFNAVARHYIPRVSEYHPLTEAIGKAMGSSQARPIMLGIKPPETFGEQHSKRLLLVGQLRSGQGIEQALEFLAMNPAYTLALMGAPSGGFDSEIRKLLDKHKIADRVYYPGKFVTEGELRKVAASCFAALALYDTSRDNFTHYADPGKVKNAIEMGLPVVMTRISGIVPYLERFHAGEVIDGVGDLSEALAKIQQNASYYLSGCKEFSNYFNYETYYRQEWSLDA